MGESKSLASWWLSSRFGGTAPASLEIHPDDEMFRFSLSQHFGFSDLAHAHYLWQGRTMALALVELLEETSSSGRILDFAAGFGRASRWLVSWLGPERVVACEIQAEAVRFLASTLGIRSLDSVPEPEAWDCRESFELVWAGSLFTHLPAARFGSWLAKLASRVEADGLLAFTVFSAVGVPPGAAQQQAGHWFLPQSESQRLSPAEYGTAWVSDQFLSEAFQRLEERWRWIRIPNGVLDFQDLVLARRERAAPALPEFDPGPVGMIEQVGLEDGARLFVSGWAYHPCRREEVETISAGLGSFESAEVRELSARPQADLTPAVPLGARVGFRIELPVAKVPTWWEAPFWLAAKDRRGREKLLRLETGASLLLRQVSFERDLWKRRALLTARSRFGSLHRLWLRAKQRAGFLPKGFPLELLEPPQKDA